MCLAQVHAQQTPLGDPKFLSLMNIGASGPVLIDTSRQLQSYLADTSLFI